MTDKTLVERLHESEADFRRLHEREGGWEPTADLFREAADRINTLELEALGAGIKIDALERMPLAVLVGHGRLVASVGEFLAKHCVLVKEPADDRLVLAIFGANDAHLSRIADALNDAPPPGSDQIRSYVFNAFDALEGGLDRGTVQDNLVQELLRIASAQPAEAVEGCRCQSCGDLYVGDLLVPDEVWEKVAGSERLLCASCLLGRIVDAGIWSAARATSVDAAQGAVPFGWIMQDKGDGDFWPESFCIGSEPTEDEPDGSEWVPLYTHPQAPSALLALPDDATIRNAIFNAIDNYEVTGNRSDLATELQAMLAAAPPREVEVDDPMVERACNSFAKASGKEWPDDFTDEQVSGFRANVRGALADALQGKELGVEWFCESHPEQVMGHDGCAGAGILECSRIPLMANIIRLLRQELRERDHQYGHLAQAAFSHEVVVDDLTIDTVRKLASTHTNDEIRAALTRPQGDNDDER